MLTFPPIDRHGVQISPTSELDIAELDAAYDDEALFEYFPVGPRSTRPGQGSIRAGLDDQFRLPLTVRSANNRTVVGSTSLHELSEDTKHVTVVYSILDREWADCKAALLDRISARQSPPRS